MTVADLEYQFVTKKEDLHKILSSLDIFLHFSKKLSLFYQAFRYECVIKYFFRNENICCGYSKELSH